MSLLRPVLLAVVSVALLAGCSGDPTVSQSEVEDKISSQLEAQVGQKPDSIDCPGDLAGKVGETMKCTLTAGEDKLGVSVVVTKVDGKTVNFDIKVDDAVQ